GDSSIIDQQIDYAFNHGVLVVVSGGNCGGTSFALNGCAQQNDPDYPAGYALTQPTHLIPVAATDWNDELASFSTVQDYLRVAGVSAPGAYILSTGDARLPAFAPGECDPGSGPTYCTISGTSMAAPHVAGLATLLW